MRNTNLFISVIILVTLIFECECLFDWLFGQREASDEIKKEGSEAGALIKVPFEMTVADEKFLAEGKAYGLQQSDLDLCHHKAIMQIHTSCHEMSEEDIGKLSVRLLSCQSAVEGRTIFHCTDQMTLRDCTKNMDQTTWNAYHIVSNRARAVCYAVRQQQFTVKTEMTVDKLMSTTEHQLFHMEKIKENQEKVGELAQQTLQNMAIGQNDLMQQQERLKTSQSYIHNFVVGNLRELVREKALIAAGQKELAYMTDKIRKKLDEASTNLQQNEHERLDNHKEVIKDLAMIQNKSKDVWKKIDQSTQRILKQHIETANKYQETLENLQRINETVSHLMTLVENTRIEVNMKLGWLGQLLGGAGDQLTVLNSCILHVVYFLLAAIIAAFIQAPYFSRLVLLILVPLNAFSEVKQGTNLEFSSLTVVIVFSAFAQWTFSAIYQYLRKERLSWHLPAINQVCSRLIHTNRSTECQYDSDVHTSDREKSDQHANEEDSDDDSSHLDYSSRNDGTNHYSKLPAATSNEHSPYSDISRHLLKKLDYNGVKRDLFSDLNDSISTRSSRQSSPMRSFSRSSTPSKRICIGYSKSGKPCKGICISGKDFCHHHCKDE